MRTPLVERAGGEKGKPPPPGRHTRRNARRSAPGPLGNCEPPPAGAVPRRWPHKKAASDEPGRAQRTRQCSGNSRRGANTGRGWRWREHVSICTDPRPGAARTLPRYCRRQHGGSRADPRGAARPWPRCRLEHVEESDRALRQPRRPAGGRRGRGRAGTRKKRPRRAARERAAVLERAACESRGAKMSALVEQVERNWSATRRSPTRRAVT